MKRTKNSVKIDYFQIRLQEIFHINRLKNNDLVFYHGSQWFSITDELVRDLLRNKKYTYTLK